MQISIQLMQTEPLTKNGYPVKLIASHKGKVKRKTLFHSFPQFWDFSANLPLKSHPNYNKVMPDLYLIKSKFYEAEKMIDLDEVISFLFKSETEIKYGKVLISTFIDKLISELKMQNRDGHAGNFLTAKNEFLRFFPEIGFEELSYSSLNDYKNYLLSRNKNEGNADAGFENLSKSTVHGYLKMIRIAYYEYCRRYGVEKRPIFEGIFNGITVKFNRNKKKFISEESILKLESSEFESRMGRSVDFFLLTFYLGGVNLRDLYFLKNRNIHNGRIFFKRGKKGADGYEFDLKLFEKAAAILEKYRNSDSEYVFSGEKSHVKYRQFYTDHRRALVNVQAKLGIQVLPTGGNLTYNVARHSFSTIGVKKGINREIKALLMGHELGDIQSVYEDYPQEMRDLEHWKIINLDEEIV